MSKPIKLVATICLCFTLIFNATGCGTILYPERKGQIDGQLDPAIVILNILPIIFYVIPSVIAFAVDFSNGTIYLPNGEQAKVKPKELEKLSKDIKNVDELSSILYKHIDAKHINLNSNSLQIAHLKDHKQLERLFEITFRKRSFASL